MLVKIAKKGLRIGGFYYVALLDITPAPQVPL